MLHVGFRAMHESMTSQKIKKLGAGGGKLGGGAKTFGEGGMPPPRWLRACLKIHNLTFKDAQINDIQFV